MAKRLTSQLDDIVTRDEIDKDMVQALTEELLNQQSKIDELNPLIQTELEGEDLKNDLNDSSDRELAIKLCLNRAKKFLPQNQPSVRSGQLWRQESGRHRRDSMATFTFKRY